MIHLKDALRTAQEKGVAIGHFNVADLVLLSAVTSSARQLDVPVIVGASEGERSFLGDNQLVALVKSLRDEYGCQIFLNADHSHSLESAIKAAKAGFDSIVLDHSSLPFEENIKETRDGVAFLKDINPDIVIEGEIGDIGTGSEIHDKEPDHPTVLSTPSEARHFVEKTGVDVLAPAVGNRHGMSRTMMDGEAKKRLNIALIREIKEATRCFLTLHGASGTDDQDLRSAIAAGINVVHINTELRVAWRKSLEASLTQHPKEVVPYKLLPAVERAVSSVVLERLKLFNCLY